MYIFVPLPRRICIVSGSITCVIERISAWSKLAFINMISYLYKRSDKKYVNKQKYYNGILTKWLVCAQYALKY